MKTPDKQYRYPGVQPFNSAQQHIFFGRDEDVDRMLSLVLQERLCVLYGKSGHGKSSLINAGITPALVERNAKGKGHYISIPVRFNIWTPQDTQTLFEKLHFHLGKVFQETLIPTADNLPELPSTLWGTFKAWNLAPNTSIVLLFDQFEEYFSYPPEQQFTFKEQLAELLYTDYPQFLQDHEERFTAIQSAYLAGKMDVRALFSIRSDRLSDLDRLKDRLPAILHKRFELRALMPAQAREAITKPAASGADQEDKGTKDYQSPAFQFTPEALQTILQELTGRAGAEEGRIEAFLLQIVCSSIEKRVEEHGIQTVTGADLPDFERVFEDYYQDRVDELPETERTQARRVLEEGLLLVDAQTSDVRRLSRDAGELGQAFGVPPSLLQNLERTYLVRREVNSLGGHNYEISHDTLIPPMLKARKAREAVAAAELLEKERVKAQIRAQEAEEKVNEEKRRAEEAERLKGIAEARRKRARLLAFVASVVAVLALAALLYAWRQQGIASAKQIELEENFRTLSMALEQTRIAQEARLKAESEKVWKEVDDILNRATKLEKSAPAIAKALKTEAFGILDQYPDNPFLSEKRKTIRQ